MKISLACPKCESRRLWRVEKLKYVDHVQQSATSRPLRLALARKVANPPEQGALQRIWHGSQDSYDAGVIDAYVCAQCGYTELYARDIEELEHNPEDGVHLIDTTAQRGKYR